MGNAGAQDEEFLPSLTTKETNFWLPGNSEHVNLPPKHVTSPAEQVTSPAEHVTSPAEHVTSPAEHVTSSAEHVFLDYSHDGVPDSSTTSLRLSLYEKKILLKREFFK